MTSSQLLGAPDLADFQRLGIPEALLQEARVRRVTSREAREQYGIRYRSVALDGVLFPYIDPESGLELTFRLRRDVPERDTAGKAIAKYIGAPDRHRLYFPPGSGQRLADLSVPVVMVEAEKSALALTALGARTAKPMLAVATGGCWGWRGTIGKTTDSKGARVDEKGPLPDLDRIVWTGRTAILLFDSNAATNASVASARTSLKRELISRGADVRVGELAVEPDVNGPDDFIAKHGDLAMVELLESVAAISQTQGPSRPAKNGKESQASQLVRLVRESGAELFHDDDQAYVHLLATGRHETYALRSVQGTAWLRRVFLHTTGKAPSSHGIADAVSTLEALALVGPEHRVYVRIARGKDRIYVDLGGPDWSVVEITPAGWSITHVAPVRFRRTAGILPLATPIIGGNLMDLRDFVNVSDRSFVLLVGWIIGALNGRGPYPVLVCSGEQGSAKSTLSRVVKALIDPTKAALRSEPRDERDLMIAACNGHLLAFDNLSTVPPKLSDALCRLATGGGFSTRKLYHGREEEIFDAMRPVLLNGIPALTGRPDLASRALVLELATIPEEKRVDERTLWSAFEIAKPGILGSLFEAAATALRREASVRLSAKPRMADFAHWVTAAEPACPWSEGQFLDYYASNRHEIEDSILDGDPVAELAISLAPWDGTAAELKQLLFERTALDQRQCINWIRTPRNLADALRRLAPSLRRVGIEVVSGGRTATRRLLKLRRMDRVDSTPSATSSSSLAQTAPPTGDDDRRDEAEPGRPAMSSGADNAHTNDASDGRDDRSPSHDSLGADVWIVG